MSLRDRISDLEKKFGADKDVFKQKCEEYAEFICTFNINEVEHAIEYKKYEIRGIFAKTKYVRGYVRPIRVIPGWSTITPDCSDDYIVRSTKEARAFADCIASRLKKEGFECEITHEGEYWYITCEFAWK